MRPSAHKKSRVVGRRPKSANPHADTRAAILKAARHVFARRGVDGASVREIAEAAKVNNAMIYYHFTDKNGLYRAVVGDSFSALDHIWEDKIFQSTASARKKMQRYIEELIRFEHSNEELRKILSIEFATSGKRNKWLAENYFRPHYKKLVAILNQGVRSRELKKYDHAVIISTMLGMVVQNFINRPIAEYVTGKRMDLSIPRFGKFVAGVFFEGLTLKPTVKQAEKR